MELRQLIELEKTPLNKSHCQERADSMTLCKPWASCHSRTVASQNPCEPSKVDMGWRKQGFPEACGSCEWWSPFIYSVKDMTQQIFPHAEHDEWWHECNQIRRPSFIYFLQFEHWVTISTNWETDNVERLLNTNLHVVTGLPVSLFHSTVLHVGVQKQRVESDDALTNKEQLFKIFSNEKSSQNSVKTAPTCGI